MNRRSFLKALTAFVGVAAVPVALVEACQTDAPTPKDWTVGIIDREGTVLARENVASLDYGMNLCVERTGVAASFFVEGGGLPGRVVGPILMSTNYICAGGAVCITSLNLDGVEQISGPPAATKPVYDFDDGGGLSYPEVILGLGILSDQGE